MTLTNKAECKIWLGMCHFCGKCKRVFYLPNKKIICFQCYQKIPIEATLWQIRQYVKVVGMRLNIIVSNLKTNVWGLYQIDIYTEQ